MIPADGHPETSGELTGDTSGLAGAPQAGDRYPGERYPDAPQAGGGYPGGGPQAGGRYPGAPPQTGGGYSGGTPQTGGGYSGGTPQTGGSYPGAPQAGGRSPGEGGPAPLLVTRLGRQQRIFPVGAQVRVGRDPSLELVSVNPLVSRQCHGVITSDEGGATYVDQSRRGTFLNGKRLRGPLRITESVVLRLGDPATGEELGITPPLSSSQLARNQDRRVLSSRVRKGALAAAVVVVAAGLTIGIVIGTRTAAPAAPGVTLSGGLQPSVLRHAEAATVRLLLGSPSNYTGWGSGTVIGPDGLILTNAHVAEPQAPGAAVAEGIPSSHLGADPPYLTVELTTGPSSPVVARYRAKPLAVDGYLDLAVVQIYATDSGQPVNPGSLHLPYLPVGNVSALQLDQPVTVLGFPGVADSDSITVTSGVVSTFVPDPLKHVGDPRFELETTARVAHGNSGGAAINNAGQLIGVPSLAIPGEGNDVSWRLRSVAGAMGLIAAVRDHTAYHSKILVQLTGSEQVTQIGVAATTEAACTGSPAMAASTSAVFGFSYARFPLGLDIAMVIALPNGTAVTVPGGGLPQSTTTTSGGCFSFSVSADQLGLATLPAGTYHAQLLAGPNLATVSAPAALRLTGAPAGAPPAGSSPAGGSG
jgi:putative serine protease PepD